MTSFIYARQYDGEFLEGLTLKVLLAASITTAIVAPVSFVVRILLSKRRGHRILSLNSALSVLALIAGLIAVALFTSFAVASRTVWVYYNLGQFFASTAAGLTILSIVDVLFSNSRNTGSSWRGFLGLPLILGLTYLVLSFWPLYCGRLSSPAAPLLAVAFSWTHGVLLATTFLLLLVAFALEKRGPAGIQVSTRHRATVAIYYLLAIIQALSNAFYVAVHSDELYNKDNRNEVYTNYGGVYVYVDDIDRGRTAGVAASVTALMIFLVSFLVANLQAQNSPAKPEETETKENHAAQSDQVDGPASCAPSTKGNPHDSMFIIQGARVPGYRESTGQDVQRARCFHRSPPPTGILRTISVDVVVEDREEDEWHDAEGQRGPRGWEAALRRGPQ
ncbi:hypothetical protein D7B24_005567 [Verticillium nonalfalfae]|uniref:Uncharacterized protein n=1 Tax=Verticillium nonalfalfae TaxID=1051616 RepID=A0A3M9YBN7_9PEZI|nr:uncharacterized protein D7B24_005567 [Verticillium nonalfalfae]RNJ57774.1 hypothetical protein D7B24_005567 [Verticillium nonalfalfae]